MIKKIIEELYDERTNTFYYPYTPFMEMCNYKQWIKHGYDGRRIKWAILDTGFLYYHPLLKNNIKGGVDFTGEGLDDKNGHGTMCALLLVNYAQGIQLYNVKVMDENGRGCEDDLLSGLKWCEDNKINSINISLGIPRKEKCNDEKCQICKRIKMMVTKLNTKIYVSAGNEKNTIFCPACSDYVFSIGALNDKLEGIADYSANADFYAPGAVYLRRYDK